MTKRGRGMRFDVALMVVGGVIVGWAAFCVRIKAWQVARTADQPGRPRAVRMWLPRQRTRPTLPAGHRPPAGLGPLSPSERFLTQEAARGLRELQIFLVDQRA